MSNAQGGRPQTYVGALEDRHCELHALALDLIAQDAPELQALRAVFLLQQEALGELAAGELAMGQHKLARAQALTLQLIQSDVTVENRGHRELARISRGGEVPD